MARYVFRLPDVGEGVVDAEIAAWRVAAGEQVAEDQPLVDVMTDKATVEISAPVTGQVLAITGVPGERIAVGSVLVEFEVPPTVPKPADSMHDGSAPAASHAPKSLPPAPSPPPESTASRQLPHSQHTALPRADGRTALAAPATRARAFALGIPLQFVPGTGPAGRITPVDLDTYIAGASAKVAQTSPKGRQPRTATHDTKIIGLRRLIAERMQDAKRRIPHFSYIEEFDLTELEGLRKDLNETRADHQPKLTLLPFFMLSLVRLQPQFPSINATYDDEAQVLRSHEAVHIGIATQTAGGLMVPVVRHAESLDLWGLAHELRRVTDAARHGKAKREELSGSTVTLTSLGALGGIAATPVINAPEVAIIGPNKLVERPVIRNGQLASRTLMNLSASFDHRIIDGYEAARFIQALRRLIERPALLFTDET